MLLNATCSSTVFRHFCDPSPPSRKSENVLSIPVHISTNSKKNRVFTVKCSQKSVKEEEEATKNKKLALAEWLSTKKPANNTSSSPAPPFKSTGTPSAPSRPEINSKYSPFTSSAPRSYGQPIKPSKTREPPSWTPKKRSPEAVESAKLDDSGREVVFGKNGLAYRLAEAPFEFQYTYTETPKVKPLALREAAFVPFGPTTMGRPWTGRAPLPPSKKKRPEFDSFKLPPPNKKGVKHIQPPGPFVEGQGPKYVKTREKVLGERLTREEVKQLVESSCHSGRQLNIGRDGLTHNMLENIHAHWKRRRVCKIKCKGVATVDMDNICNQLEDKTGGKIIHRAGGAVYLFRGRNYNYKTRPVFPMMLWKPAAAVYPRLIERAPGGLTIEEAKEFCKKGQSLLPICKLAKNGVYLNLVKDVRDAFEVSDLVRVDCQGLIPSDYKKIGAKLKDLVPCVLLSFEYEHILMWRGKDWKPNEQDAGAPQAHLDRECLVADSVEDTTRYTVTTALPFDEKCGSEHAVSEYALTKENVPESNSMPSKNVADEALGDKDGIPTNIGNSTGLQHLVKNADDTNDGEFSSLEDKLGTSSSEVEYEELIESNEKEIFSDGYLTSNVSVSAPKIDTECVGEDSEYNSLTSSKVELEELVDSSVAKEFSDGLVELSVSVLATNTDEQCLGEDSAYNSEVSDVPFCYGVKDAAISASKQLSADSDALSKTVNDVSYHHPDLNCDSSKISTESFFPASETSVIGEDDVESTNKESNLYSYGESELYAQVGYAEETNGPEKLDGYESIANSTSEISQGGVGFHIEALWGEAIHSGRVLLLDESALDPDIVHEKAIAFGKDAPEGPFFKRRFSRKTFVKKPWKRNSHVKTNESEGQKSVQRNFNRGESFPSDDLPSGGLPLDELARLLAQ